MVDILNSRTGTTIDLSFMASLECDLKCLHCMYWSSPKNKVQLDYDKVCRWVETINWRDIHACGFYGGEPSILPELYQQYMDLVPVVIPKFMITDGTWSKSREKTESLVAMAHRNNLQVFISQTPYHLPYQDQAELDTLVMTYPGRFFLKGNDKIISMGRARNFTPGGCTGICAEWIKPYRIALHPTLGIIFQSCDGSYPVLQGLDRPFSEVKQNIYRVIENCVMKAGRKVSAK